MHSNLGFPKSKIYVIVQFQEWIDVPLSLPLRYSDIALLQPDRPPIWFERGLLDTASLLRNTDSRNAMDTVLKALCQLLNVHGPTSFHTEESTRKLLDKTLEEYKDVLLRLNGQVTLPKKVPYCLLPCLCWRSMLFFFDLPDL